VDAVLSGVNRRPIAVIGLAVAAAWLLIVAIVCFAVSPWDHGGWYAHITETADLAWHGVLGVAALVWLLDQVFA
jgi:hypothetical protein